MFRVVRLLAYVQGDVIRDIARKRPGCEKAHNHDDQKGLRGSAEVGHTNIRLYDTVRALRLKKGLC